MEVVYEWNGKSLDISVENCEIKLNIEILGKKLINY